MVSFVFLAHRSLLNQHTAHGELHDWLATQGGISEVQFVPSSIRRHEIHARLEPHILFGDVALPETLDFRVTFEFPEGAAYDFYELQVIDSDRSFSIGWHQDETHPDLGKCHFQLDHRGETVTRRRAVFHDAHPLGVLETRLGQLPAVLDCIDWTGDRPSLSQWPPDDT